MTAESCTGGWIAKVLTDVPGSSGWFLGGVVAYSNTLKQSLLGVLPSTLAAHGAVSEATAREMAVGALETLGGQVAVAVTGHRRPGRRAARQTGGHRVVRLGLARATRRSRRAWRSRLSPAIARPSGARPSRALSSEHRCDWMADKNRRLFFALWPTDAVRARLAAAAQSHAALGRAIAARNLHVTVVFLGAVPAERVAHVVRNRTVAQKLTLDGKFMLHLDAVEFWRRSSLVVPDRGSRRRRSC